MFEKSRTVLLCASLLLMLVGGTAVIAQESNRVAIVVSLEDGDVLTRCVEFDEVEITGYEALSRSGLLFDSTVIGLGASVCQIEGVGCPAANCFCECKGGGSCLYWSYWQVRDGEWKYSQIGATIRPVVDGDVEGWVWDIGTPSEAPPPPTIPFEEICQSEEPVVVPALTQLENVSEESAPDAVDPALDAFVESAASEPTSSLDEVVEDDPQSMSYLVGGTFFTAVVIVLISLARRGRNSR